MQPSVYCDYNATAPLRDEVKTAIINAMDKVANPSSVHAHGREARKMLEDAREAVAAGVGACREDITFTSGGTEGACLVLNGARKAASDLRLIVSSIEHDAVLAQADDALVVPVTRAGVVDLDALKDILDNWSDDQKRPFLSLMAVNNETGVIQPLAEAVELIHAAGGLAHTDAVQAIGKIPFSILDADVDYISFSSHKIGGPQGVGAVYIKPGAPCAAMLTGGGQETSRRAGTQNLLGAVGFDAAIKKALADMEGFQALSKCRDDMELRLQHEAGVTIYGKEANRVANTSCFGLKGFRAETQVMALDLAGFSISAGSACSSGKVKPSHVIKAMGEDDDMSLCAVRASFGWQSAPEDFERFADAWISAAERAGALKRQVKESAR